MLPNLIRRRRVRIVSADQPLMPDTQMYLVRGQQAKLGEGGAGFHLHARPISRSCCDVHAINADARAQAIAGVDVPNCGVATTSCFA